MNQVEQNNTKHPNHHLDKNWQKTNGFVNCTGVSFQLEDPATHNPRRGSQSDTVVSGTKRNYPGQVRSWWTF